MCRVFGVTRNGYYCFQKRSKKPQDPTTQKMAGDIQEIAKNSKYCYGSRRITSALRCMGYSVNRRKVRILMRQAGVEVRYRKKYKVTTNSEHNNPVYDNVLNRNFAAACPNQAWVSDITYIWTQEGWLYLAVVIDLFSRKVVGWSMSSRMKASLVCDALNMALWQRKAGPGLIVHTDRGSQYTSKHYRGLLKAHRCVSSMSRKGNCWDNAVAESFFGSLKQELVQWRHYQSRKEAQQDILDYIVMFYNSNRLHSYLGYQSPNHYEGERQELKKAA
jgi:putative transposase